jgi:AcrR family transcriptional regulator
MSEPVNPRRYDTSRREAQTRATRREILDAARSLFVERGYVASTMEEIATRAGAGPATVYRLFGSKRGLLAAVLDVAFVGDDEPVAFGDRPSVAAALAETDPRRLLEAFAGLAGALMERSGPIQLVLRGAASVDAEAAELLDVANRQRLEGQSRIARALASRGLLRGDLDEDEAADIIYTVMSPDVYRLITVERGWSADRYERWLARALCCMLLDGQGRRPRRHAPPA